MSLVVTTGLFALLYRVVLFTIGQQLIGLYLGHSSVASSFSAAGSRSCCSAEFTRVYAQARP